MKLEIAIAIQLPNTTPSIYSKELETQVPTEISI